jgi:hypothetical protein
MPRTRTAVAVCAVLYIAPYSFAQHRPTDPLPVPSLSVEEKPVPINSAELVRRATAEFNRAKESDPARFATARDLFGQAVRERANLTPDQSAAWAYCRVRVAADRLNKTTDSATAGEVIAEVEDALATVPQHRTLHDATADILAAARKRAGVTRPTKAPAAVRATEPGWETIDTANFRVRYAGSKAVADELARAAEAARGDIFKKWSGPPGGNWSPKCEIVIHPTAEAFATATKLPAAGTGRAEVKLGGGAVESRRIDLRADDATASEVALPRELTHVVIADLFPNQPPPKWAELGMAVLSTPTVEVRRYLQTVGRCARDGELPAVEKVLAAKDVPAKAVTGFHVESVALVEFLVRWRGEKVFTGFVRDALRYGTDAALTRQYGLADARALEDAWKRGRGE